MVDRLQIEDDSRNKVNMTKNIVVLSKPFIKRIENGYYVGRLLHEMSQTYEARTGRPLLIPNELQSIDAESPAWNAQQWQLIFDALEQYQLPLSQKKRDLILKTTSTQTLLEIVDALFEIDNSAAAQTSAATKRKLEIKIIKTPLVK
jgi:hypothetical protein